MALIQKPILDPAKTLKIKVPESLLNQAQQYCQWQGIEDPGYFFLESARYVLQKDIQWRQFEKSQTS